jgi:thiamine-phosphate pyrophosphorylase
MREKYPIDYSLYLVTDRSLSLGRSSLEVIRAAVGGGVTVVQLREKDVTARVFYREGLEIREFLATCGIPLIINDRLDIALALDADGVHLGQDDIPVAAARRILGRGKIVGASVLTAAEARQAEADGADYLGLSPIFITPTKPELTEQIGMNGISRIRAAVAIPLVGIGGLSEGNASEAIRSGLAGVAVVSAICSRQDPRAAAAAIKEEVLSGRRVRDGGERPEEGENR